VDSLETHAVASLEERLADRLLASGALDDRYRPGMATLKICCCEETIRKASSRLATDASSRESTGSARPLRRIDLFDPNRAEFDDGGSRLT